MSRECIVCGKSTQSGHKVSHSNRRTNRKWMPNIQKVKIMVKGTPTKSNVCTRCLKANKVDRAI